MEIIRRIEQLNTEKKTAVAVGYFDGMHLGHKALIHEMLEYAAKNGLTSTILTFDMSVLRAEGKGKKDLYPREHTIDMVGRMGVDQFVDIPFELIRNMSPKIFCDTVLSKESGLNAGAVFCGEDFRFGKDRIGSVKELKQYGMAMCFSVFIVDEICLENEIVSTSRIKELIVNGQIRKANEMLGEPYSMVGKVIHGNHLAQRMGFPTANMLIPANIMTPKKGVYLTETVIESDTFRSITNIGTRPTVTDDVASTAETHILDFTGDLYGKQITIFLHDFIRPEQKFENTEDLQRTVMENIEYARSAEI